jgi:hypothetical protein
LAIVSASLVNRPGSGCVASDVTLADHLFTFPEDVFLAVFLLADFLLADFFATAM